MDNGSDSPETRGELPARKSRAKRGVGKQELLLAAFDFYSDEGEDGFSLRKLAALCGVDPMTILHHFRSKDLLLRAVADHAVTTVTLPQPSADWQADLLAVASAYRELAHRHPRVVHLHFKYHATGPADHVASEVVYRAMQRAGLSAADAAGQGLAFYAFVLGFALAEAEGLLRPIGPEDEAELMSLDAGDYLATRALVPAFASLNSDAAFEAAMNAYVNGVAQRASQNP